MKPLFLLLSLLAIPLLSAGSVQATATPLTACVGNNSPASWQEGGTWRGMHIDIFQALAKRSGLAVNFADSSQLPGVESLKSGECSIMAEIAKTEERAASMHFLGPYAYQEMVLVMRREDLPAVQVDNLQMLLTQSRARGLKVGIERHVFHGSEFQLRLEKDPAFRASFEFVEGDLAEKMNNKRLLALFLARPLAVQRIADDPAFANFAVHPFTLDSSPLYLAVSRAVPPETLSRMQRAMATLIEDGTFAAIAKKWAGR